MTTQTESQGGKSSKMRVNLLRYNSIIGLAALALPVLCFAEQRIGAQVPVGMAATRAEPDGRNRYPSHYLVGHGSRADDTRQCGESE